MEGALITEPPWADGVRVMFDSLGVLLVFAIIWVAMNKLESARREQRQLFDEKQGGYWRMANDELDMFDDRTSKERAMHGQMQNLRRLKILGTTTGIWMAAILAVAHKVHSLVLICEGIHILGDCTGYFVLFVSTIVSQWPPSVEFTYGYGRVEPLCGLGILLLQLTEGLKLDGQAYNRLWDPPSTQSNGQVVLWFGLASLMVNMILAVWLHRTGADHAHDHAHSCAGDTALSIAYFHILCDLAESAMVMISGTVLWIRPDFYLVDSMCTFVFTVMLLVGSWHRGRDIIRVLVNGAPNDVSVAELRNDLFSIRGVTHIQELRVWTASPGQYAVTAHIYVQDDPEDALSRAEIIVKYKHGVSLCTLRVCDDEPSIKDLELEGAEGL